MASINELSLLPHNNTFIPDDRIHRGNAINDFKNTLFNTDGNFLDWQFKSSLKSKYGHTLFVKEGSIKYEGNAFVLEPNTILQYNLTNNFPKKNLSIKIKVDTQSSKVDINLGGFIVSINSFIDTAGSRKGRIDYFIIYEDNTFTLFPQINGFTQLVDGFVQNTENEYQFVIDNDNEEIAVLVNGVVLSLEPFSHLKNIKIDNQQFLSIKAGPTDASSALGNDSIKISELIITQTDILQESTDNLFSLKLFLINDSLVFYDPTNQSKVNVLFRKFNDSSPNNSHLQINYGSVGYVNNTHFLWKNSNRMLISNALTNSTVGELVDFSINIWFYISNSNELRNAQTLLVIGDVAPSNKSMSLHINRSPDKFKLSVNHYPTNITLNDYLFEKNTWYNIIYVKTLSDYSFYVDGVFVSTVRMVNPINLPINAPLSIGMDHSRLSYFQLRHARVGLVSVYERALNSVERSALYEDYKIYYQNIPLLNTLFTCDLTKSENVFNIAGFLYMRDTSGNDNSLGKYSGPNVSYDGDSSIIFTTAINQGIFVNSNMLQGNVSLSFNIWILVNKQTGPVPPRDQRILTIGDKFHLTLVITDNDLYGLSFGIESIMGERQERILKPDVWYNVTGTRNNDLSGYSLYVDNVIIKLSNNNSIIDFNNSIRLGYHSGTGTNTDHLQLAQIGTLNIFEKGLNLAEIEDLHYLYNVRYLLKNSHVNCRISENFDPLNPNFFGGNNRLSIYTISSSSFRFTNENLTYLYTTNVDDFDFFDGKSFDVSKDVPGFIKVERRLITNMKGLTNVEFPHSFNCWFKLNQDASGLQHVLGYGSTVITKSYVMFIFNQVGDTNKFIPNLTTHITNTLSDQDFILPEIETDEWYFFSFNRDTINKVVKVSINGEPFMSQSYIDEMDVDISFSQLSLGGVQISSVYNQQSSVGNFSLFDRPLSIREVKSIFDLDKDLYEPGIIIGGGGGGIIPIEFTPIQIDRRIRPSLKTGITTEFNFKESLKGDISDVNFDGTNFISNDGFVEVAGGTFMEVVETLPSYILDSTNNHSWVIQFRALSVASGRRMSITSMPSSVVAASDFSGFRISVSDTTFVVEYDKAPNEVLVFAIYTLPVNTDLSQGIHQVVTTFNRFSNTLKIYFNDNPVLIATTTDINPIFYAAGSTIVLNKISNTFPQGITEYHKVTSYNRVLSETDVNTLYNEIDQPIIPPPSSYIAPVLLFGADFNNSLDVDYTQDSSALVFQESETGAVTLNQNSITINPGKYIDVALPAYLKTNSDQSWIVHFRTEATSGVGFSLFMNNTLDLTDGFSQQTGFEIILFDGGINTRFFKSPGTQLVTVSDIFEVNDDLSIGIHQIGVTYSNSTKIMTLHLDVTRTPRSVLASDTSAIISYQNSDSLRINDIYGFTPTELVEVFKIAVYDKVLTREEIITMYNEAQPVSTLLVDFQFNQSLEADYTKDFSALVFQESETGAVSLNPDNVTVNPGKYLELATVLPDYLRNIGDQSWIIHFKLLTNNGSVRMALTTSPVETTFSNFTGVRIFISNETVIVNYYKGLGDRLVNASYLITAPNDLSAGIHQIVTTYNESTQILNLYFDDRPVVTSTASTADPIFYSADSTLVLHKLGDSGSDDIAEYHRVASYDKVFTDSEVLTLYNQIIQDADKNPTYTFQIRSIPSDRFIMPYEVKAFNFNDVRINLQGNYTTLIPHNGHEGQSGYDLTRIFDYNDGASAVWWNTKTNGPHPIVINIGDQLFSVTIPTLPGDTLRDRQVKYFEIIYDQDTRAPGLLILRNGVTVYDDGNINNGLTRQIFTKRYILPLPDFLQEPPDPPPPLTPPPPPTPPTPPAPINPTIPDMHWDYETFYDNQNAVEFSNYNVNIVDGKAVIDAPTDFLLAFIPSALVSKFSISLIFNFKALNSGDNINFIFTTFTGFSSRRQGIMLRVINGRIEFELHGKNGPAPNYYTNTLYRINEPITGFPNVIFDEFCNLAITFDYNTKIIKTYINGVLNSSTNALVSGVNLKDVLLGTNFGGNTNVNFFINLWVDRTSYGLNELDDFKFFNSVLTDEEVTHYYNESIA